MKLNISLQTKINIVFIFTFILLFFVFFSFAMKQKMDNGKRISSQYKIYVKHIHKNRLLPNQVISYLKSFSLERVENPQKILNDPKKHIFGQKGFEFIQVDDNYYLHILTPRFRILFLDKTNKFEQSYSHYFIFAFILLLFLAIYVLIIKNIKEKDLLLNSRQLFLRTIMHELKTPIAKGRIVSELIDNEKQKNRMINVFDKLSFLIDDFAKVEQLVSKNYKIQKDNYKLETILENAISMLMLDKNEIDKKIHKNISNNIELNIDLELCSMALKNLLDNGLKYSNDNKVVISQNQNQLQIISSGKKLPKPLNEYFKPFHNETKSKNHGMGLGLYLVYSILQLHNMRLEYEYKNGKNIFKIVLQ